MNFVQARGLQCKNFWSNQVFAPHDRSERVQGIENPMFMAQMVQDSSGKWVPRGRAKSRGEALKMCDDICWKNPSCEGFNFEERAWGCYFLNGFEKLERYQICFL